jgi:hypothetical protein
MSYHFEAGLYKCLLLSRFPAKFLYIAFQFSFNLHTLFLESSYYMYIIWILYAVI